MLKLLALQQWYGLSDPELERQVAKNVLFQHFLGFPGVIPDYTTVCYQGEADKGREVRQGVERATEADGEERAQIREEGVGRAAQDATFITSDPRSLRFFQPKEHSRDEEVEGRLLD
jgi:IS5 family transposase